MAHTCALSVISHESHFVGCYLTVIVNEGRVTGEPGRCFHSFNDSRLPAHKFIHQDCCLVALKHKYIDIGIGILLYKKGT